MKRARHGYWLIFDNIVSSTKGYKTMVSWQKDHPRAYEVLIYDRPEWKEKFFKVCFTQPFQRRSPWSFEKFLIVAKKYKSMGEWTSKHKQSINYFYKLRKSGIITKKQCKLITAHMKSYKGKTRTLKECKSAALKYSSKIEWRINDPRTYKYAYSKVGWLTKCTKHMPRVAVPTAREVNEIQPKFYKEFKKKVKVFDILYFKKEEIESAGFILDSYTKQPDFFVYNKKLDIYFFIEIKKDYFRRGKEETIKQIKKYNILGKRNFDDKFKGTLLAAPNRTIASIKMKSFNEIFAYFLKLV